MEGYGAVGRSLCYGPLSQPAERVLAALRAQALPPSRNSHSHNHPYRQRGDGCSGGQRENSVQGGWTRTQHGTQRGRETQRRVIDPNTHIPLSQPQPCSSSSRPRPRSDSSSDSSWESSGQTGRSPNPDSVGTSAGERGYRPPSADHQQPPTRSHSPSGTLPFTGHRLPPPQRAALLPAPVGSQRDDRTLHRPYLSAREDTNPWRSLSEEPEIPFTLSLSPEGPDLEFIPHPPTPTPSSEYCLPQQEVQPRGVGTGGWAGRQKDHWAHVPSPNPHKVCLSRLERVKAGLEPLRENNGLSRTEGTQFSISIADEIDTASVHGTGPRPTESPDARRGFPHEPGAGEEERSTTTPELSPVLVAESSTSQATRCRVQTLQETAALVSTRGGLKEEEEEEEEEESPLRPEGQTGSSHREPCPDGAAVLHGPDATRRDEGVGSAEVVVETDTWRVQAAANTTQTQDQMVSEEGWTSRPVQREEEEEEEGAGEGPSERGLILQEMLEAEKEPLLRTSEEVHGSPVMEGSPVQRIRLPPRSSQGGGSRAPGFRVPPGLHGNALPQAALHTRDHLRSLQPLLPTNEGPRMGGSRGDPSPATPSTSGPRVRWDVGDPPGRSQGSQPRPAPAQPPRTPAFPTKRKRDQRTASPAETPGPTRPSRPARWAPPPSSQGSTGGGGDRGAARKPGEEEEEEEEARRRSSTSKDLGLCPPASAQARQARSVEPHATMPEGGGRADGPTRRPQTLCGQQRAVRGSALTYRQIRTAHLSAGAPASKPQQQNRARRGPGKTPGRGAPSAPSGAARGEPPADQAAGVASDPRVKDVGRMSLEERAWLLSTAGQARAMALTLVYQDGSTQLDPEQNPPPTVSGLLVLMRRGLDHGGPGAHLRPGDTCLYLRLEHTPAWARLHTQHSQDSTERETLVQLVSGPGLLVCYKVKDLLRTALQHYRPQLSWKQVLGCRLQDPQVSGWLLDPADPATCYQDLLNKHLRPAPPPAAPGTSRASQAIAGLSLLCRLNLELCAKLQSQGLWQLYSRLELSMIPVLAAMESHRIHVDREALKTTSDMLGTKLKQLEQEAHQAAGQIFLVSSSTQLRTVLFDKLCLHERCENKKLPKTINKQQQSTSEAALLQLRDLHPLPNIILEYRQVHKIKSTFVDGILSCMEGESYISSSWLQTSAVTGRVSAKHPNFQALPRQPVQITKKQYIHGKDAEVVTVHPRTMFIPQPGWTFLAADFCQVELRLLAHLSGDPELLRVFSHGHSDVFTMLASRWKGVRESEVSSEEREHAKRIVYSVVYGAGRERLSGILGVSAEQASRFQDSFLQTYREVQTFIQATIRRCHQQGYVVSLMGRRRALPLIHSADWGVRMQAERQAVNFVVQGSAADLCKMAMIRITSEVGSSSSLSARLIAQLHDELLFEVEDSQLQRFAGLVKGTMEALQYVDSLSVPLKVPLKVALSSGKSWGSMSELSVCAASPSAPPTAAPPP